MEIADPVLSIETTLDAFTASEWNGLVGVYPFMQHGFLSALHDTGCAATRTGWTPYFLALRQGNVLVGAMPLYVKSHSRGEYVFDHAWADAFARHGLAYYPKLLCAVPFTPVSGPRLLAHTHEHRVMLARGAIALARHHNIASLHILFTHAADVVALSTAGFMLREGVQFHWRNAGFADMDAFLATMSHDKRKKIKQDRRRVADAGVSFAWLRGDTLDDAALDFFYRCYAQTYYEHGNPPYLSRECFARWHAQAPEQLLLIMAYRDGAPIACALDVVADGVVYGRYWGTQAFVSGLHFETCYLQSIAYCIEHGLAALEGGAQGEHKMARGLLPTPTWSAHWIADKRFAEAIGEFLDRETEAVDAYIGELDQHTPFKRA